MSETSSRTRASLASIFSRISGLGASCSQSALMDPHFKGLRAYANWLLSNYEIMVGASQIKARPLKLTFDATNVCQLRCPLCPTGLPEDLTPGPHRRQDKARRG